MHVGALIIGDEILSGKRQDKHLSHTIATLAARGLALDYAQYMGDDRDRLTAVLRESFARDDLVFSFGGIGATPDDHTRQAAAAALGVPLERHPEAVAELEAKWGAEAYPNRVLMAEFPQGSRIIPNPFNRVAAFAVRSVHARQCCGVRCRRHACCARHPAATRCCARHARTPCRVWARRAHVARCRRQAARRAAHA